MGGSHLLAVLASVALLLVVVVEGRTRYNSQVVPSNGIKWADFNGDGVDEFYLGEDDKLYIATVEYTVHGRSYSKLNGTVSRTFHGKFVDATRDTLCAEIPSDERLFCYRTQSNFRQTWRSHRAWRPDVWGPRDIIVGDFDGDGKDDLLGYTPSTGALVGIRWDSSDGYFCTGTACPAWFSGVSLANHQIRAGKFNSDDYVDLLFYNPSNRRAHIYFTVYNSATSMYETQLAFSSPTNWVGVNGEIRVADLDGDGRDDIVVHNTVTGAYRFVDVAAGFPALPSPGVTLGGLYVGGNSNLFFGKFTSVPGEDGGRTNLRDDALVLVNDASPLWIRSDARYTTSRTYVREFVQFPLDLDVDQDGDKIKTRYELGGFDPDNDGFSDEPLHTYGASPFQRDVFVEIDYMVNPSGHNFSMRPDAVSRAVQIFAEKDLNLHVFVSDQIPFQSNLGDPFSFATHLRPIKDVYFTPSRYNFFYYSVFAPRYGSSSSSGLAQLRGQNFIVTLAASTTKLVQKQVGTFLHELGHCLGLKHGGNQDVNHKANHLSIMSYLYQFSGLRKNGLTTFQHYYSEIVCDSLDEKSLSESAGVVCATNGNIYQTKVQQSGVWTDLNTPLDWNNNGVIDAGTVLYDANKDGKNNTYAASYNEYEALSFAGLPALSKRENDNYEVEWEPPVEDIPEPESEETAYSFSSSSRLRPHDGTQFLSSPHSVPPSLSPAFALALDAAEAAVGDVPVGPPETDGVAESTDDVAGAPPAGPSQEVWFEPEEGAVNTEVIYM